MTDKKADREAADLKAVVDKIASWEGGWAEMGARLHRLVLAANPALKPRLWYGMPGYALDGPVLCYFRVIEPYMTLGLSEKAFHAVEPDATDQLMPAAWFLSTLDEATEQRLAAIVRRATG
ncbi:MAG: DUF1801 domain-containing protein [Anaerolineae bacterium]|jgi:hypothetical protein|nr:DUF1801 domain-containing protein [Chloroflexota bacterium]